MKDFWCTVTELVAIGTWGVGGSNGGSLTGSTGQQPLTRPSPGPKNRQVSVRSDHVWTKRPDAISRLLETECWDGNALFIIIPRIIMRFHFLKQKEPRKGNSQIALCGIFFYITILPLPKKYNHKYIPKLWCYNNLSSVALVEKLYF